MKFIRTLTGNGSLATPVNIWRPRRKVMAPLFSLKNLNCFVSVFAKQSEIMVKRMQQEDGNGDFSFWKYINTYTFDSICKTSLGIDLNSQLNPDQPCLEAFDVVLHILSQRLCSPWLYLDSVYKLLPCYKTFLTNRNKIYDFVDDLIKCKSKEMAARDNDSEEQTENPASEMQCLLEIMIKSSGGAKGYTDLELREEMLVIILAGTDTSAVGAAYTALMLSRHPEVQEKVFQELQAVFQGSNRPVAVNDLPNLKYLEAVIKETLRIYPPVPVVVREVINDVELPSGKTLVNGVGILMNFWAMHRNPKYWGEDAEQFRPERFLEGPLKHPGQFMPFSYSMRNCIGSTYAMMSMKTVLATLVRQYQLLPPADLAPQQWADPLRVKWDIMMKHVDNYMIRIRRRK
uniref:Cytochrome p450 n=1 Tax=Epiphyas postvittana TaxID=65032 RepID=A0A0K8TV31_EPIPO